MQPFTIETVESGLNYARYKVEPLEPGYGTTMGNALRRILLRSLPGAAISRLRIEGVWHEFATVNHVREDVTEIVLNLKRIRVKTITPFEGELSAHLFERADAEGQNEKNKNLGEIPIDAIYTPIQRVNFVVEQTRVGGETDFDRLILEILTDGTIEADDALSMAAQVLVGHAQVFASFGQHGVAGDTSAGPIISEALQNKPLADLGLS